MSYGVTDDVTKTWCRFSEQGRPTQSFGERTDAVLLSKHRDTMLKQQMRDDGLEEANETHSAPETGKETDSESILCE